MPSQALSRQSGWRFYVKKVFDFAVAGGGLIILSPLFLGLVVLIRIALGRPIFFKQARPGFKGKSFIAYKFRTMREAFDAEGKPLADELRLSRIGRLIRRLSLDEIPQLWNVVRGDLSLVGPRPLLQQYLSRYSAQQFRRHDVLPGITGWAQVHGRNATTWEERFNYDLWYVDHWSLFLDIKILIRTMLIVIRGGGISQPGHATMPEFMGDGRERSPIRHQHIDSNYTVSH